MIDLDETNEVIELPSGDPARNSARVAWIIALALGLVGFTAVLVLLLGVVMPMRTELDDMRARLAEATERELEARAELAQAVEAQRRLEAQSAAMSNQIEEQGARSAEQARAEDEQAAQEALARQRAEDEAAKKAAKNKRKRKRRR